MKKTKAIDVKAREVHSARTTAEMLAQLEGRSASRRSKARRALWTQEFLASGKPGK